MSIMLIRPPFIASGFDQQFQEPLNLCYLAAVLRRDGFDVRMLDAEFCDLNAQEMLQEISHERPELVGISVMSEGGLPGTLEIAEGIRQWAAPDAHITAGGHFATFNTDYLLRMVPAIDSAVLFEGENVICEFAKRVLGSGDDWHRSPGIMFRDNRTGELVRSASNAPLLTDLDALPFPARDLLPKAIQLGLSPTVLSSRGCSGRCSFCTIHQFVMQSSGMAWRGRSPQNVVDEIKMLVREFDIGEVGFLDDDFIGTHKSGKARALAIADLLIREKLDIIYNIECRPDMVDRELFARLKDSGLRSVFVGIEGVTPAALKTFNKGINIDVATRAIDILTSLGLDADVGFILYHPDCTMDEVKEGFEFLKRHGQFDVHTALNRLYVVPGSAIRERLAADGRLGSGRGLRECNDYEFADRRVGSLLAILRVAILPVFQTWYDGVKEFRKLRADLKFQDDAAPTEERMTCLKRFCHGVDGVVERCFEEAFDYAMGQSDGTDILQFSRQLRQWAGQEVQSMYETTQKNIMPCSMKQGEI